MKISKGMYIRCNGDIDNVFNVILDKNNSSMNRVYTEFGTYFINEIESASFNIIDLIEYMDLLEIEGSIKIYGENKTVALFNPVRCDGFTEFEDGTHCIILNLDYLVDVKDLKIKSVLTKEQFDACKYVVERDKVNER